MPREYQVYYYRSIEIYGRGKCKDFVPGKTHSFIKSVWATSRDDVYEKMQGHNWSPNGEGRSLIRLAGVRHTSMSVGDVAVDGNGDSWMVMQFGWEQVGQKEYSVW